MVSFKIIKRRFNLWKTDQLKLALEEGNVEEVEYLRKKKDPFLGSTLVYLEISNITPAIADLFINKFTDDDWKRWGFKPNSRDTILCSLMNRSLIAGREEVFEQFMDSGLDFNTSNASSHPISFILLTKIEEKKAANLIERLIAKGIDKVAEATQFPEIALDANSPFSFDILVKATAADIHVNNEGLLRKAAQSGKIKMARHLVERHSSDINTAITTERTLGHDSSWKLLETLRLELSPSAAAPPTIESLSSEIILMKQTIRELTARVETLQPPVLDKPTLSPAVLKSGGPK